MPLSGWLNDTASIAMPFLARLVNVNGIVYGKVYFPVRSNRLKDLGAAVGASWPTPNPSGIESIAWRFRWEDSGQADFKAKLLAYNQADCNGLRLLTAELQSLSKAADTRVDVDFTNKPKQMTTATGEIVHRAFDGIINSAHDEYQQKRIRVIKAKGNITTTKDGRNRPRSYRRRKRVAKSAKPIIMHPKRKCPHHPKEKLKLAHMKRRVLIDLVFTRNGCRKKLVKYEGRRAFCALCKRFYSPPSFKKLTHGLFGHAFRAWTVYQRIAMRLPYAAIAQSCEVLFSEPMNTGTLEPFLHQFAKHYAPTERLLLRESSKALSYTLTKQSSAFGVLTIMRGASRMENGLPFTLRRPAKATLARDACGL